MEVIKNIVKKINSSGDFTYNEGDSKEKILDSLIQERLQGLGDVGKQISELLKYASFIGLSFPKYEVERLIECSHIELSNLIDKSDEICLTTSDKKNAHFTHDLIRMIFAFILILSCKFVFLRYMNKIPSLSVSIMTLVKLYVSSLRYDTTA